MHIADLLRKLLDTPKPKDERWQEETGRAVSKMAIEFLNETNDVAALRSVALLELAKSLGVKEARKRTIKLSRWAMDPPPLVTTLTAKDEQQAALTAITKITAPWSSQYAKQSLADLSLPMECVSVILQRAHAMYADNLVFIQDFYAPQIAAAKSAERTMALLKDATKLLKPSKPVAVAKLGEGMALLVEALLQSAHSDTVDQKAFGSSVDALLNLVHEGAATVPPVLIQPVFVIAFERLSTVALKGIASKHVAAVANTLTLSTISLLVADIERYGSQAANHWKTMVPAWRKAYPGWDASIKLATVLSPALAGLTTDNHQVPQVSSDTYATEAVFARLLPAWDAFVAELPDANRAESLSAMLRQAASTVGIAALGQKDTVVRYDPLSHHLMQEEKESPHQVRIVRPGVQVLRPDGSSRVLETALVVAI